MSKYTIKSTYSNASRTSTLSTQNYKDVSFGITKQIEKYGVNFKNENSDEQGGKTFLMIIVPLLCVLILVSVVIYKRRIFVPNGSNSAPVRNFRHNLPYGPAAGPSRSNERMNRHRHIQTHTGARTSNAHQQNLLEQVTPANHAVTRPQSVRSNEPEMQPMLILQPQLTSHPLYVHANGNGFKFQYAIPHPRSQLGSGRAASASMRAQVSPNHSFGGARFVRTGPTGGNIVRPPPPPYPAQPQPAKYQVPAQVEKPLDLTLSAETRGSGHSASCPWRE